MTGTTPATSRREYYGGTIPFVTPPDLDGTKWITNAAQSLTPEGLAVSRALPPGCVLVSCIGTLGKVGLTAAEQTTTNQQINAIIPKDTVGPEFMYYAMMTQRAELERVAGGVTVKIVNKSNFEQLEVPLPPLDEQRRISQVMATIQDAQVTNERVLAMASDVKRAFLNRAFTDLAGKKNPIGEVANVRTSFPPYGKLVPTVRADPDHMLYLKVSDIGRDPAPVVGASAEVFKPIARPLAVGATVFPKRGAAIGKNVKRMIGRPAALDPNLIGIEPSAVLLPRYLLAFFEGFDLRSLQDDTPVPQLNKHNVDAVEIPVPSLDKQELLCEAVSAMDAKEAAEREVSMRTAAVFAAALARLVGGDGDSRL